MSDNALVPNKAPGQPYIIQTPYFVIDARFENTLRAAAKALSQNKYNIPVITKRVELSSGSARYDLYTRTPGMKKNILIASFQIMAATSTSTALESSAIDDFDTVADGLLKDFVDISQELTKTDNINDGRWQFLLQQIGKIQSHISFSTAPTQPRHGDSLDAWLDWREHEQRKGNRITLEQIRDDGGFSLSTLKKKSAERKIRGRGTKKEPR